MTAWTSPASRSSHTGVADRTVRRDNRTRRVRVVGEMTQHIILSVPRYEIIGRVLLGLDPQSTVI
jgi:hypothetical protein